MEQTINVNSEVTVTLTEYGKFYLARFLEKDLEGTSLSVDEYIKTCCLNEDGTYRFMLWEYMRIFGSVYHIGMGEPITEKNMITIKPN